MNARPSRRWRQYRLLTALALAVVLVVALATVAYQSYARDVRSQTQALLTSLARTRATAIRSHLDERVGDGWVIARRVETRESLDSTSTGVARGSARVRLRDIIDDVARAYGYHNIVLLDRALTVVAQQHTDALEPQSLTALTRAVSTGATQTIALHRSAEGIMEYGIATPVWVRGDSAGPPQGVLYLVLDAARHLFPLLQAEVPGRSYEGLLIQQQRDSALVMSTEYAGQSARLPVRYLPEAAAERFIRGDASRDFRNIEVISGIAGVTGSPWVLVANVDRTEAEQPIRLAAVALTLAVVLLSALLLLSGRSAILRERRRSAREAGQIADRALSVVQSSIDGYIVVDPDGRIVEVNDAITTMTGFTTEELLAMTLADLNVPGDRATADDTLQRLRTIRRERFASRWQRKDGTDIDLDVSATALGDGERRQLFAFVRDITDDLAARRRLERVNRLYAFLNRVGEQLFQVRSRQGAFDLVCRSAVQDGDFVLACVGEVDATTGTVRIVTSDGDAAAYLREIHITVDPALPTSRSPMGRALGTGLPVVENDFQHNPDTAPWHEGARTYGIGSSMALPIMLDGKTTAAVIFYHREAEAFDPELVSLLGEISRILTLVLQSVATEARRAEEQQRRRRSEERFRNHFESLPVATYVVEETSGRVQRVNRAFIDLFGYQPDELPTLEASFARFFADPVYRVQTLEMFRRDLAELGTGATAKHVREYSVRHRDGSDRLVQAVVTRTGDEVIIGWIDLTELRTSQTMLREAQQIARLGSWGYDFPTAQQHCSRELIALLDLKATRGVTTEEIVMAALVPGEQKRIRAALTRAVGERESFEITCRVTTQQGTMRHALLRARIEYDEEGEALRAVGSAQDVTEEVEAADELQRYRSHLEDLVTERTGELAAANTRLQRRDMWMNAMLDISQKAGSLEEREILQFGVDQALRLSGSVACYIHVVSDDEATIASTCWDGPSRRKLTGGDMVPGFNATPTLTAGVWAGAVRTREPLVMNVVAPNTVDDPAVARYVTLPIVEGNRLRMVLGVINKPAPYEADDVWELQVIAHDIWSIVQQRRNDVAVTRAYEHVKASDERFAFAMEASSEGIWDWDMRTDRIAFSTVYVQMLGYDPAGFPTALAGWLELIHADDRLVIASDAAHRLRTDGAFSVEFRMRASNGEYRWMLSHGKAVEFGPDGEPVRAVGTQSDLTARKNNEDLLRAAKEDADNANRAKSSFLAVMSHEIRTPLNGVIGMAEVLAQSALPPRDADAVRTIRTSATNLLGIIDDILDFSKIEAGRIELEHLDASIGDTLDGISDALSPVAAHRGVDLSMFIAPDVPAMVCTDAIRLRQILYNLIGNAIKFSGGRATVRGRVHIRVEAVTHAPLVLRMTVQDNGIGMSADTIGQLFTSFTQAEISTTRRFGGTGLGLAICKRLAELLGGNVTVTSVLGEGSAFVVTLPMDAAGTQPPRALPDIDGLDCLVVREPVAPNEADDIATYLQFAGALVTILPTADMAVAAAMTRQAPVVIVQHAPAGAIDGGGAPSDDVRHVRLTAGQSRVARVVTPNFVTLDRQHLRERNLVRAVAIAAGRASPEILYDEQPSLVPLTAAIRPVTVAEARAQGRLILVAEDDEINQKVIMQQLELLGYAAEVAPNGLLALERWRTQSYALLLTDLHMPEMDGYQLTQQIRADEAARGDGRRLPIMALTANALRGEETRGKALGLDDYLTKPVLLAVLKAAIGRWIPPLHEGDPIADRRPPAGAVVAMITPPPGVTMLPLDVRVLEDLVGDDHEVICDFLTEYARSADRLNAELLTAVAQDDLPEAAAVLHKLKSSSRSVGALPLGELCSTIERAARDRDTDLVQQVLPAFGQELAAVQRALTAYLDRSR
ncbi:MAG: PAS domain S-box protein [Gemmatimonadota bacterium]|nr:PAS domain S-box protein [Gemmatimonadota bacterium]